MLRKVQVENGVLQGLIGRDPRVTVFRGIPYAKPPVRELRWRAPQPAEHWEGVRKCYEYGPIPMMRRHPGGDDAFYTHELNPTAEEFIMSEDCLYLNIFSPARTVNDNLPVFCYIHGGGLQDGYNYEVEFDGERLARRGIIVVMISYRLGLMGFLAHPELTAQTPKGEIISNFGLQDQSFALHWVKRNIAAFGGNPNCITICGQSAGAASVQAQLCSPMNEGLISGVIAQSAISMAMAEDSPDGRYQTLADAEAQGSSFFQQAGIQSLEEARKMDAFELMKKVNEASTDKGGLFGLMFGICIDGKFVTEPLSATYYNNRLPSVPMIVGVCADECRKGMFTPKVPTYEEFVAYADVYGQHKQDALRILDIHNDADVAAMYERGEYNPFIAGTNAFCEIRSAFGNRVYSYIFDHDIPGDDAGSFHGSDLWFMFDSLGNSWRPFEGKHYDLARQVASYWINFVKYGNPNGDGTDYHGNTLPVWRPYTVADRCVMNFSDQPEPVTLAENPILNFRLQLAKEKYKDR